MFNNLFSAYGGVYLTTHRETGFVLAVKVVQVTDSAKSVLEKEIDVLKKCKHPNILSYFGTCSRGRECWVTNVIIIVKLIT